MTVPRFGRITPLQGHVLGLAGEVLGRLDRPTDEQRLHEMKASRDELRQATGKDFGYDLANWHTYLIQCTDQKGEYTHMYAWDRVKKRVLELIDDEDRLRLVRMLGDDESSTSIE